MGKVTRPALPTVHEKCEATMTTFNFPSVVCIILILGPVLSKTVSLGQMFQAMSCLQAGQFFG